MIVILETKGDDRDNTDAAQKLSLGTIWANKAGERYRYMMVFKDTIMDGAIRLNEFVNNLRQM